MFYENNLFWILIFICQIIILNFISQKFHSYLFHLTGVSGRGSAFSAKISGFILFIGTLVHELSHVLMAAILFVKVKALSIKAEITEDKHVRFGSAEVELVDPFRNAFVGIAPLIFGIVIIYFLASDINFSNISWFEILKLFLISQISNSMFLSKSDTVYFKFIFILMFVLIALLWAVNSLYLSIIDFSFFYNRIKNFLFSDYYVSFLMNLILVFLFVITFNLLINLFLKVLSKYKRY